MTKKKVKTKYECWDYEETTLGMTRYQEEDNQFVSISSITVPTQYDKDQLLKTFKYLHNNFTLDTEFNGVNYLVHLYQHPELIIVQDNPPRVSGS